MTVRLRSIEEIVAGPGSPERCGVWTAGEAWWEADNISATPEKDFSISVEDTETVARIPDVVGIWHTHPDGQSVPSQTDLAYHPVGMRMLIMEGGVMREFDPADGRLLGVRFFRNGLGFGVAGSLEVPRHDAPPAPEAQVTAMFIPRQDVRGSWHVDKQGACKNCGSTEPRAMVFLYTDWCCENCRKTLAGES